MLLFLRRAGSIIYSKWFPLYSSNYGIWWWLSGRCWCTPNNDLVGWTNSVSFAMNITFSSVVCWRLVALSCCRQAVCINTHKYKITKVVRSALIFCVSVIENKENIQKLDLHNYGDDTKSWIKKSSCIDLLPRYRCELWLIRTKFSKWILKLQKFYSI